MPDNVKAIIYTVCLLMKTFHIRYPIICIGCQQYLNGMGWFKVRLPCGVFDCYQRYGAMCMYVYLAPVLFVL